MRSYVDFHCHLDLFEDFETKVKNTESAQIYTLAVTTTPRAWPRNHELTAKLRYVRPALGLHPQIITKDTKHELKLWDEYLNNARYVGEVGLDASANYIQDFDIQKDIFKHILTRCSERGDKVLSVHAVRSVDTVLDMIERYMPRDRGVIVLHWFTGTKAQAKRALKLGCFFSVNYAMLRSKRGKEIISLVSTDRILTETDAPFLDDRSTQSEQLKQTVEILGTLLNMTPDLVSEIVLKNFKRVLSADK
jgi:TatD DNase family protein